VDSGCLSLKYISPVHWSPLDSGLVIQYLFSECISPVQWTPVDSGLLSLKYISPVHQSPLDSGLVIQHLFSECISPVQWDSFVFQSKPNKSNTVIVE